MIAVVVITGIIEFTWIRGEPFTHHIPTHPPLLITPLCFFAARSNAGNIVWSCFYGFFSGALQSLFTPCAAKLAPSPAYISVWVGIGVTIVAFGALGSQPIAGRLLDNAGDTNFVPMQVSSRFHLMSVPVFEQAYILIF
jgi:hypothetical protein